MNLPFVDGRNFWDVAPSGNWVDDCTSGREFAQSYLAALSFDPDATPLLSAIVGAQPRRTEPCPIAVGFWQELRDCLVDYSRQEAR